MNLQQLSPEHFYCSATDTGRRLTTLLCHYQVFNTLSCWNLAAVFCAKDNNICFFPWWSDIQDDKFNLLSPLPSPSLKSQHATEIKAHQRRFILLFIKWNLYQWRKQKEIQEGQKWYFHKSCSSGEHIPKQVSKKAALMGQCCILPLGLRLHIVEAIQNHTKMMFGAKHWLPQARSSLRNCLHTWPSQSIVYPVLISSCLCIRTQN